MSWIPRVSAVVGRRMAIRPQMWQMRMAVPVYRCATPVMIPQRFYATEKDGSVSLNDPTEAEAQKLLDKGTEFLEIGDMESAMAEYRKSIGVFENASAYYNLGICQYQAQDLDGAIASWKEALRLSPDSPDAHTNLASAYIMSKPPQAELALSHLKEAASLSPDDGEIHFNLATVLEACEQLEEAVKMYKKAKENGVDRAEQNVRNCMAKLMAARIDVERQEKEIAEQKAAQKKD
ncbi:hypothetical protein ACI68E_003248 [Malassezia pachydermatis]|uniref:Tpr-like protein n=1 Tax=Malassezia pachydermatis TaxID=77020 RepID=A0A0M8MU21_9BASI|nr:tpr-like protein [Malassezia pachydermatis]KOS14344.1 tpr-like protein [Malassezia pachydermatis]